MPVLRIPSTFITTGTVSPSQRSLLEKQSQKTLQRGHRLGKLRAAPTSNDNVISVISILVFLKVIKVTQVIDIIKVIDVRV